MGGKRLNLVGERFGKLVVLSTAPPKYGRSAFLCLCDCGAQKSICGSSLARGASRSCGCMTVHKGNAFAKRHGLWQHRLHGTWRAMKQRCHNRRHPSFQTYGARGIYVCDRWLTVENFIADNEHLAIAGTTLDRIDNDGPYSPENCRWITPKQQARNRRDNIHLTYSGRTRIAADWAEELGMPQYVLFGRLAHGWSMQRIVETPYAPKTYLPPSDIRDIRAALLAGVSPSSLARKYSRCISTIRYIRSGRIGGKVV